MLGAFGLRWCDPPLEVAMTEPVEPAPPPPPPQPGAPPPPPGPSEPWQSFADRAEGLGKEAEAAAKRWSSTPGAQAAGDTAARVWGLVLLAAGIWFLFDVTLGYDMP